MLAPTVCYYDVLGIQLTSSKAQIVNAYRRMAMKWHPDRHVGEEKLSAEVKFKEISFAYDILSNEDKRLVYDKSLESQKQNRTTHTKHSDRKHTRHYKTFEDHDSKSAFDILREGLPRGKDVFQNISLEISEADQGCDFKLKDTHQGACHSCNGTGGNKMRCQECHGHGYLMTTKGKLGCTKCDGYGSRKVICDRCDGNGTSETSGSYSIKIHPGVVDSSTIIVEGKGKPSASGGFNGNLIITINIIMPEGWSCTDDTLHGQINISFPTAVLGGNVNYDLPSGKTLQITIPPMTDSGKIIRLVGRGLKNRKKNGYGDVLLKTCIVLPTKRTKPSSDVENVLKTIQNMY
jgi:molecular chaperone DnaJ